MSYPIPGMSTGRGCVMMYDTAVHAFNFVLAFVLALVVFFVSFLFPFLVSFLSRSRIFSRPLLTPLSSGPPLAARISV